MEFSQASFPHFKVPSLLILFCTSPAVEFCSYHEFDQGKLGGISELRLGSAWLPLLILTSTGSTRHPVSISGPINWYQWPDSLSMARNNAWDLWRHDKSILYRKLWWLLSV